MASIDCRFVYEGPSSNLLTFGTTIDPHRIVIGDRNIISESGEAYDPNVPYDPQLDWDNFGIDNYNVIMSSSPIFLRLESSGLRISAGLSIIPKNSGNYNDNWCDSIAGLT